MNIRLATNEDAPRWLELFQATLGEHYPAKIVQNLDWIAEQLSPQSGNETWVVDIAGRFQSSVTFLGDGDLNGGLIANLGRNLHRSESLANGSAEALVRSVTKIAAQRGQMIVTRISASANSQQILYENQGYTCVGFQPLKHLFHQRVGTLFYVRPAVAALANRTLISESLPQIGELASVVFERLQIANPQAVVRDGRTGYPLQTELIIHDATPDGYELRRTQMQTANPVVEVSGRFNLGFGQMRVASGQLSRALLCQDGETMVAGLLFYFDEHDRCVRITDSFGCDQMSMGALFARAIKIAQDQLDAVYTEVDILASAPRLLKSAEQLGFVPVAYLPAFCSRNNARPDVVKMVKLNLPYTLENCDFTAHARSIAELINHNFEDQKIGLATIKLLRPLAMFTGLGDGELRKISRLFSQKLFRPGEPVFAKGDSSDEAYIVLRGQIDILLEPGTSPLASLSNGKIFGELAFLDGATRSTCAVAAQPSILLIVRRLAFLELVRSEPALGMVVMRNIALDLAAKLRNADLALAGGRDSQS